MTTRYFLNAAGDLASVEEPGRCSRYWELWGRRNAIDLQLADRPDEPRLSQLEEQRADAAMAISAHLEICKDCQSWLDACRQHVFKTLDPVQA
jgi:hypothetical protein